MVLCLVRINLIVNPQRSESGCRRQHEECGRLLCKECLEKYGRDKPCPNWSREQKHSISRMTKVSAGHMHMTLDQ